VAENDTERQNDRERSTYLHPEEAAKIAKRHGLSLSEALALKGLAQNVEQAERIAASFTSDAADDDDSDVDYGALADSIKGV
jgi:hypothetical protein